MSGKDSITEVSVQPKCQSSDIKYTECSLDDIDNIKPGNDPTHAVESRWGIGWRTPSTIILFYVLALIIALMHLVMFLNLDGQITDRKTTLKQTYVSVLSTLFVTMFSTCLGIALGVAFTQHLWYLFRNYPMTVETIETLFCIRGTPILLLDWSGWTAAPVICSMATVILLLNIVRVFPPGALTVVSRTSAVTNDSIVPTFTADFVGNTSYNDAHAHAISLFGVQSSLWEYMGLHPVLGRIAYATLSTGDVLSSQSPCGTDCNYNISFEGPHLDCETIHEIIVQEPIRNSSDGLGVNVNYIAGLSPDLDIVPYQSNVDNNTLIFPVLSISKTEPIGYLWGSAARSIASNQTRYECQPGSVTYDLQVKFENGTRSVSYSKQNDFRALSDIFVPYWDSHSSRRGYQYGADAREWSDLELANLKFTNIFALVDSVARALKGFLPMYVRPTKTELEWHNITLTNGTTVKYRPCNETFRLTYGAKLVPENGTIVAMTRLNKNRDILDPDANIDLEISADLLNEMVANVTLSTIFAMPNWNTTTKITTLTANNFYSFSHRKNLFVPYGVSLLLTLPFLVLGMLALQRNGVSAMDGSFVQMLMTTTASRKLNMKAAGGCLGGENNVPEALMKEKILFGELGKGDGDRLSLKLKSSYDEGAVRCAGFGLEDEVSPLRRRGRYGVDGG